MHISLFRLCCAHGQLVHVLGASFDRLNEILEPKCIGAHYRREHVLEFPFCIPFHSPLHKLYDIGIQCRHSQLYLLGRI
jgi:hypothetical protein